MEDGSRSNSRRRERGGDDDIPSYADTPSHHPVFRPAGYQLPDRDINAEAEDEDRVAAEQRRIRLREQARPRRRPTQAQQGPLAELEATTSSTAAIDALLGPRSSEVPDPSGTASSFRSATHGGAAQPGLNQVHPNAGHSDSNPPPATASARPQSIRQPPKGILKKDGQEGEDNGEPQKKRGRKISFGVDTFRDIPARGMSSDEEEDEQEIQQENEKMVLGDDQSSDEDEYEVVTLSQDLQDLIAANLESIQTQRTQLAGVATRYNAKMTSRQSAQNPTSDQFSASDRRIVERIIGAIAGINRHIAYLQRKAREERSPDS